MMALTRITAVLLNDGRWPVWVQGLVMLITVAMGAAAIVGLMGVAG